MMQSGLSLDRVSVALNGEEMVALSAEIPPGTVMTVMGPSGVGKSTLLAAVTGTLAPAFSMSGQVLLNGVSITHLPTEARRIGLLFQDDLLFPHMSVGDNLAFGLTASVKGRAARRQCVEAALAEVGLDGFAERDPATLSGGQKARVALMRMLLADPYALLLDEAFSRLDSDRRARTRESVFAAAKARGLPVLQVTHDIGDAEAAGGPVVELG